jgi:transposase-like protein
MAVDRLNQCENIVALAKELGISRRLLYTWREQLKPRESNGPPASSREATLRKEVSQLKRVLAEKVLEVDFSQGLCTPSRRDASGTAQLARRHLRPHPGT